MLCARKTNFIRAQLLLHDLTLAQFARTHHSHYQTARKYGVTLTKNAGRKPRGPEGKRFLSELAPYIQ